MVFKRNLWAVSMMAAIAALTQSTYAQAESLSADKEKVVNEALEAEESVASSETSTEETVVVRDRAEHNLTSFQHLTREDIAKRPTEDGNITDLLKSNPAVQFSTHGDNSMQMGEIKPSNISIHGAVAYQNNYMLDGVSTNSDLDPAEQTSVTTTRLGAADEQGFYVDSRLIDSVTVYDHNIPVNFGGFTGGVVDASTRSWRGENHFSVFGRMTKSGWSQMHTDPTLHVDSGDSDISKPGQFQTDFEKRTYGFNAEFGLTDDLGIVMGYSRRESKIPTVQVPVTAVNFAPSATEPDTLEVVLDPLGGRTQNQTREADNFFMKATLYATPYTEANLAFTYSGYESRGFLSTVANSGYQDKHDGYNLTGSVKHQFEGGVWDASLAYTLMRDKRTSDTKNWTQLDQYTIEMVEDPNGGYPTTQTTNMQSTASGGLGDLSSTQGVVSGKLKVDFEPVIWGQVSQQWTLGTEWSLTRAEYERQQNYYRWTAQHATTQWGTQTDFYTTRWKAGTYKADYNQGALYLQDTIGLDDWMVRAGLRGEYDNFTKDFNIAPRLSVSWDLVGNGTSIVTLGANRYYGRNILTYALYGAQNGGMENTYSYADDNYAGPASDWFSANDYEGLNDLKTPYNDEWSLGLTQRLWDWSANIAYVHRDGYDEVRSRALTKGEGYNARFIRSFYNGGESEHDSVIFSLNNIAPMKFANASHWLRFSAAWQQTKSNTALDEGYSELESGKSVNMDYVYYDGKVIKAKDLDSTDFNIPVKFDLETTSEWSNLGLTWFNFFHLNLDRDQAIRDDGEYYSWKHTANSEWGEYEQTDQIRKYSKVHFGSAWTWDTKVLYQPDWLKGVGVSLEVYNLTNNRNATDVFVYKGRQYQSFDPGRQFWVQLSYEY